MPEPPLRRLEELFHQAVALPPEERSVFLGTACAGDDTLRATVEAMLRHGVHTIVFSSSCATYGIPTRCRSRRARHNARSTLMGARSSRANRA